jgi:uncharacterized protein YkvS
MSNIEEKLNEVSVLVSCFSTDALNLIHDERLERIDLELNKMPDDQLRGLVRKICDERLDVEITFEDKKEKTA